MTEIHSKTFYRTELFLMTLIRVTLISSITLVLTYSIIPAPFMGSLVFWLTFIANPFLILYLMVAKDRSLKIALLIILCGGWLNHLGISLTLMYFHSLTGASLSSVFLIESVLCLLLSLLPGITRNVSDINITIDLSMSGMTKTRLCSLLAILLTGFLFAFCFFTGLYNPVAESVDLWYYLNPITFSIVIPIAAGIFFLSRMGARHAEVIALYAVGLALRMLPYLFFGPVWASDVFVHQYFSETILQSQIDAFPMLYSEMSVPMYPLLSFHILTAAGLALTGNLWFFPQWTIFNYTVMFIALLGLLRRLGPRTQLLGIFLYTVFPTLISYFSLPRPFEFASALFAVAVTVVMLTQSEPKLEKKRTLLWCFLLLIVGSTAHVYGFSILLVILAFLASNANITMTRSTCNRLRYLLEYLPRLLIAFFPFLLIAAFFLIPINYIVTPVPDITRMLQNLHSFSGSSDFSIWFESLATNAMTVNIYSTFIAFFPLVGFIFNMYVLYGSASGGEPLLHKARYRDTLLFLSIQLLLLWVIGFFFLPIVLSERLGVHLGWIVLSLGMIIVLVNASPRNQFVRKSKKALQMFLILSLSFGIIVAYGPILVYDQTDFEMASWISNNIQDDSGIACSSNVKKIILAFGHPNVRVDRISWNNLIEGNLSYTAVMDFVEAGYPNAIDYIVSFIVISSNHPLEGINQIYLITQLEHSPYFQTIGLGSTWVIFEVRLD